MIDLPKVEREIGVSVRRINGKGNKVENTAQADVRDVRYKASSFGLICTEVGKGTLTRWKMGAKAYNVNSGLGTRAEEGPRRENSQSGEYCLNRVASRNLMPFYFSSPGLTHAKVCVVAKVDCPRRSVHRICKASNRDSDFPDEMLYPARACCPSLKTHDVPPTKCHTSAHSP